MLSEWHLSPDYIINNWTDELLNLMIEKLAERKGPKEDTKDKPDTKVSDTALFHAMGDNVEVTKKGH